MPLLHLSCLTLQQNACQRSVWPGLPCDRVHANTSPGLVCNATVVIFISVTQTQTSEAGGGQWVIESPWSPHSQRISYQLPILNNLIHTFLCERYKWSSFLKFFCFHVHFRPQNMFFQLMDSKHGSDRKKSWDLAIFWQIFPFMNSRENLITAVRTNSGLASRD